MSRIEFIRSKLSNFSANVSGVSYALPMCGDPCGYTRGVATGGKVGTRTHHFEIRWGLSNIYLMSPFAPFPYDITIRPLFHTTSLFVPFPYDVTVRPLVSPCCRCRGRRRGRRLGGPVQFPRVLRAAVRRPAARKAARPLRHVPPGGVHGAARPVLLAGRAAAAQSAG